MTQEDLQARLIEILANEEAPSIDWMTVERLCADLDSELENSGDDVPEVVAHFLSDTDIRARDSKYGDAQREAIRLYVKTGEYDDGVALPWRGCLAAIAIIGTLIAWLAF